MCHFKFYLLANPEVRYTYEWLDLHDIDREHQCSLFDLWMHVTLGYQKIFNYFYTLI
jgi:hypothetical protein